MPRINYDKLVRKFEEDPVPFMAATTGLLIGVSKIVKAVGESQGSRAYARDARRRERIERRNARKQSN